MVEQYLEAEVCSIDDGYFIINDVVYVATEDDFESSNKIGFLFKHLSIEYYMD